MSKKAWLSVWHLCLPDFLCPGLFTILGTVCRNRGGASLPPTGWIKYISSRQVICSSIRLTWVSANSCPDVYFLHEQMCLPTWEIKDRMCPLSSLPFWLLSPDMFEHGVPGLLLGCVASRGWMSKHAGRELEWVSEKIFRCTPTQMNLILWRYVETLHKVETVVKVDLFFYFVLLYVKALCDVCYRKQFYNFTSFVKSSRFYVKCFSEQLPGYTTELCFRAFSWI